MKIKICGIRDVLAAQIAVNAGVDLLGFILVPSKRYIEPKQVKKIIELTSGVEYVGVFMNQSVEEVEKIALETGLTRIQLHGNEDPEAYKKIGLPIIKSIPVAINGVIEEKIPTAANYLLLDTSVKGTTGGLGQTFDWRNCKFSKTDKPFFLAGGLTPENVTEAIQTLRPYGVDVSSGVETNGIKDHSKIVQFIQNVRRCSNE